MERITPEIEALLDSLSNKETLSHEADASADSNNEGSRSGRWQTDLEEGS
jgi:hypothetical protein